MSWLLDYINIFHKNGVQTNILRCLTCLNFNLIKSYDVKHISFHVNSSHLSKEWEIFIRTKYKISYTLILYKCHKSNFIKCINEKFRKYFFTCIVPDYVPHEILKEFWKNSHFENLRAGLILRCQNSLWQTIDYCTKIETKVSSKMLLVKSLKKNALMKI